MFDSNFFPPGGPQYGSFLIMLAIPAVGILGMIMIIRMRKGTKQVFRTGALPGRITGATVTAKHVGTSDTMGKEPYLALHIEYFEDGRTHSITEPPAYNLTMVDKVRKQFVYHGRYDLGRNPKNGVAPLKISDPAKKDRAEKTIANGGSYEFTLEQPIPISVFKNGDQIDWQVA
ncbi:hypothetical protein HMPREF0183_1341 [Brevibacterium mcbrellneri ATCC 49030]|uniref:Uncharacterized protein n=1 Tax=Brevibacterium mcbrellneri ATCC 49030 TaxID=585530 RepID=D4YN32_9MICO|nr:hypothetical protein [Brevibacterium mcbrellneri]EFG47350.1 hypothetical protein HMPREF0183_1341 [Brevibacterium mcbrellneri ATCC 49030]